MWSNIEHLSLFEFSFETTLLFLSLPMPKLAKLELTLGEAYRGGQVCTKPLEFVKELIIHIYFPYDWRPNTNILLPIFPLVERISIDLMGDLLLFKRIASRKFAIINWLHS